MAYHYEEDEKMALLISIEFECPVSKEIVKAEVGETDIYVSDDEIYGGALMVEPCPVCGQVHELLIDRGSP